MAKINKAKPDHLSVLLFFMLVPPFLGFRFTVYDGSQYLLAAGFFL